MIVQRLHFPSIITDNEETYYAHLQAAVDSIDYNASLQITKKIQGVNIRIAPSEIKFLIPVLKQVEDIHNRLGLRMLYSKSMKRCANINFDIIFGS